MATTYQAVRTDGNHDIKEGVQQAKIIAKLGSPANSFNAAARIAEGYNMTPKERKKGEYAVLRIDDKTSNPDGNTERRIILWVE